MKYQFFLILLTTLCGIFATYECYLYYTEPRVLEVLPVSFDGHVPEIPANYPEPVRVAYNVPVSLEDITLTISPDTAQLTPRIRKTYLRTNTEFAFHEQYSTLVLDNKKALEANRRYTVRIQYNYRSIVLRLLIQPVTVTFVTTGETVPTETFFESGEALDNRLMESETGSRQNAQ